MRVRRINAIGPSREIRTRCGSDGRPRLIVKDLRQGGEKMPKGEKPALPQSHPGRAEMADDRGQMLAYHEEIIYDCPKMAKHHKEIVYDSPKMTDDRSEMLKHHKEIIYYRPEMGDDRVFGLFSWLSAVSGRR